MQEPEAFSNAQFASPNRSENLEFRQTTSARLLRSGILLMLWSGRLSGCREFGGAMM